jgi:hypothetical protein
VSVRAEEQKKKVIGCSDSMYAYKNKSSYQEGRSSGNFMLRWEKKDHCDLLSYPESSGKEKR